MSDSDLSMEGVTLANDYHWRSTKAKKQLRDRFGRWISLGANVRFRAGGKEQAGTVTSVVDGKAYVDQKNLDGTVTQKILSPADMRVIASKATLPTDDSKIYDDKNNFKQALENPEFYQILDKSGKAVVLREDGYSLTATQEKPKATNPIVYQLYAPGGRSLGQYSEGAEDDFDSMVDEDKSGSGVTVESDVPDTTPSTEPAVVASGEEKPYRVPDAVRQEITESLKNPLASFTADDLETAERLAYDNSVSLSDVQWIHSFFQDNAPLENLRGGFKGKKWATKIVCAEDEPSTQYDFDEATYSYYATGQDAYSSLVEGLLAVNNETGEIFSWGPGGFAVLAGVTVDDIDEPNIVEIDAETVFALAKWIDAENEGSFDIRGVDPLENTLFILADSETDYEELDRGFAIIADATGYSPIERSVNAHKQRRGAGGRFGEEPDQKAVAPQEDAPVIKAKLPYELPLVENVAQRIEEWLQTAAEAPVLAAGDPVAVPEYTEEDQAVEDAATGPTDEAMYFAIVDEADKTAVLDVVAIVKKNGAPEAWLRSGGAWVVSPDALANLQGTTPPPVAELDIPEPAKAVLEQIDQYDAGKDTTPSPEPVDTSQPIPMAASGFSLPDGSLLILDADDLKEAVTEFSESLDIFVKAHIRKRATALNRLDIVPEAWREFTLAEIGELSAAQTVYGEFGEIIVASGVPGVADTPSDLKNVIRLKNYWKVGKGALKIRWGTPGDLTRAHRHLAKYVGSERAWGLAQTLHQELFGVSNYTKDVASGHTMPRGYKH